MKKILIMTDSLGLGRYVSKDQAYLNIEDTWPELLKRSLPELIIHSHGQGHAGFSDIEKQLKYWKMFEPDMVIFQVGLNDCLPRALHRHESEFLDKYKRVASSISPLVSKFRKRLRKHRRISYHDQRSFESISAKTYGHFKNSYILEMIYDKRRTNENFYDGYQEHIERYNEILHSVARDAFIEINTKMNRHRDMFFNDTFHVDKDGHRLIFEEIKNVILKEQQ